MKQGLSFYMSLSVLALCSACGPGSITGPGASQSPNALSAPVAPVNPNTTPPVSPTPALPAMSTFKQPLWRGEDPRIRLANGYYYSMFSRGSERVLFKSKSLVDRGEGKVVPSGFPLFAPIFIDTLNGVNYNAWFAFDNNVWECACADPYDDIGQWHKVKAIPFTGWSLDFEVFKNSQPGAFQNHWYMVWAGADSPSTGFGFESLFGAEILDLTPNPAASLSTLDNNDASRLAKYRFDWTDVIVEGPGVADNAGSISLAYSGNGAETSDYALGLLLLKPGADPSKPASWVDHNAGQCDGDVKTGPEFARSPSAWGPGVARFFKSPNGLEDWMIYHSKVWDTFNRGAGTQGQQKNNQMWTRQVQMKPFAWRQITCSGVTYSIPNMGVPFANGTQMNLPGGDPGLAPLQAAQRVEAEVMIPFGVVMGPTMQATFVPSTDLITPADAACSAGLKISNLAMLAADSTASPKQAGLIWYNAPAAKSLTVASAAGAPANLDLLVDGALVQTLQLPASASMVTTHFAVTIPRGATVEIAYVQGKSVAADLDYIEFVP